MRSFGIVRGALLGSLASPASASRPATDQAALEHIPAAFQAALNRGDFCGTPLPYPLAGETNSVQFARRNPAGTVRT